MIKVLLSHKPMSVFIKKACSRSINGLSPIADFYSGRSILITGGTGFVGKVLIEKLLFHCDQIDKINILIRDCKGATGSQRLSKMLTLPLFQRLRIENPAFFKKLVPVSGDITLPNLGLNPKEADALINEVSVVFHAAASVKFKDTLYNLIKHNTDGTQHVVDFAKKMKNLQVLVHVSSAYSQSDRKYVKEVPYPTKIKLKEVKDVAANNKMKLDDINDPIASYGRANTYTLTKALAEDIVVGTDNLPAIIVRPSIISPVYRDGLPGWVDSWFGGTSLIATAGKGICHVVRGDKTNVMDLVPVDYVCNALIVGAAQYTRNQDKTLVYNMCTSSTNPVTLQSIRSILSKCVQRQNFNVMPYGVVITDTNILYNLCRLVSETIPGHIADTAYKLRSQKPWYNKALQKIEDQREVMDVFTSNSWIFDSSKTELLCLSLTPEERTKFHLDPAEIDWEEYLMIYLNGISEYLMKKR